MCVLKINRVESIITILLAAYNGEKFIVDQLNSIINQTYKNWELFIRDDNSSDNTVNIIKAFEKKDSRIHLITDTLGNLGSVQNFNALLQSKKNADYIMFCDQDDVWLTNKIEITVNEMKNLEKKYSQNFPLLVHTNFLYVDVLLKTINRKENFQPTIIKQPVLSNVLCQNTVYGCTSIINQKLLQITGSIPPEAENHDYWLALVASAFGKIFYLNKRTVLYRQHGKNLSTQHDFNSFSKRFRRIIVDKKNIEDVHSKMKMAFVFKNMYNNKLNDANKKIIDNFLKLSKSKNLALLFYNFKNGVRRQTFNQTALFYLTLLFSKKQTLTA